MLVVFSFYTQNDKKLQAVKKFLLLTLILILIFVGCLHKQPKVSKTSFNLPSLHIDGYRVDASEAVSKEFPLPSLTAGKLILPDTLPLRRSDYFIIEPHKSLLLKDSVPVISDLLAVSDTVAHEPFIAKAGMPQTFAAKDPLMRAENPYSFAFHTRAQGMAHDDISCITFDDKGHLWMATYGAGIIKFDGKHYTNYTTGQGLADDFILSIYFDSKGRLLIGTSLKGLIIFDGSVFKSFTTQNGLPGNRIESLFEDSKGAIWIGTFNGGVIRWVDDTFTVFNTQHGLAGNTVYSIAEDLQGNMWFGTRGKGISMFDGESFQNYTVSNGLHDNYVTTLLVDHLGDIWVGTDQAGLARFDGENFFRYNTTNGFPDNDITHLFEDHTNIIWVGTRTSGLFKYDGTGFKQYSEREGLINDHITWVSEDHHNKLWIGTQGGGIGSFYGDVFRHYSESDGIPQSFARAIIEDSLGNLWFGAYSKGIFVLKDDHFLQYSSNKGLNDQRIRSMYKDRQGRIWVGYFNNGVSVLKDDRIRTFTANEILSDVTVLTFYQQENDVFWIGTAGDGLFRIEDQLITQYASHEQLKLSHIRKIVEDQQGNIWLGTRDGGIIKFDGEVFEQYSRREGLPGNNVFDMIIDKDGTLWVGTDGAGVYRIRNEELTRFTENNGLGSNYVYSILQDASGTLWFGTRWGLSRFLFHENLNDDNGSISSEVQTHKEGIFFKNYSSNEGFMGLGVNSRTLMQDNQGTIWIGANDLITAFYPQNITRDTLPPHVFLRWVGLFNEPINWSDIYENQDSILTLENGLKIQRYSFDKISPWHGIPERLKLSFRNNYLVFNFSAAVASLEDNARYQHQLIGLDNNWSKLSSRTEVHYGNLKPGQYTFKYRAMNSYGVFSDEQEFLFSISMPWWMSWWAITLYIIMVITFSAAFWVIFKNYKKRRTQRKQAELLLQQQVEIAKKSAEFKQSFLANMSHEIRTPLTGILGMADLLEKTNLTEVQEDYLKTLIHSGENLRETINLVLDYSKIEAGKVKLHEQVFSLPQLFSAAERLFISMSRKEELSFTSCIDSDVPLLLKADYNRIFQIVNNLLSNAVKFTEKGVVSLHASVERVNVAEDNECQIRLSIKDTGSGIGESEKEGIFKPFYQAEQTYNRSFDGTGLGLAICKELSEILGGNIGFESRKNKGSTFWFSFRAKLASSPAEQNGKPTESKLPERKALNILLVEDKIVNQKVVSLLLTSMNHSVALARNGEEALKVYQPGLFDLILMDIQMPVMDGITATQQLKMRYANLPPIVGLSANAFEGDREKYMGKGMDEYITKPVKEKDFREIISKLNL